MLDPQCIKTYYQTTMMPKVPQSMGFYCSQAPKWLHCARTAHALRLRRPPVLIDWPCSVSQNLWLKYNYCGHLHLQQQVLALWLALLRPELWVTLGLRQDPWEGGGGQGRR